MRELKFRAWDKITKKYYAVGGLSFDENGKLCEVYLAGIPTTDLNEDVREPSDIILEQYTGLNDKKGKEICEGDIVKYIFGNKPIEFGECRYWLGKTLDDLFNADLRYDLEVIGNIHENPELM